MEIYQFKSYKEYLVSYVKTLPKGGRGELSRIAEGLGIHNTTLSQVLKGTKNINLEQAVELSIYLNLNEKETEFLLLLVEYERAGSHNLKRYLSQKIESLRKRVKTKRSFKEPPTKKFSEAVKSQFYSFWGYSGIRIMTSIPKYKTLEAIVEYSKLPKQRVKSILDFMVKEGLCKKEGSKYAPGPTHTHIDAEDTFINPHRLNWRAKVIERMGGLGREELVFSAPMSLSKKDFSEIRRKIDKIIEETATQVKGSNPEITACLNIDWIKF